MAVTHNEELVHLDRSVGVFFIGYLVTMIFYGLNSYQTYIYFSSLHTEPVIRKCAVGILAILDATSVGTLTQAVHFYLIQQFPVSSPAMVSATGEFVADNVIAVLMIFIVQLSYAHRIRQFNNIVAMAIALFSIVALVLGLVMSGGMAIKPDFDGMADGAMKSIVGWSQGISAVASIAIFVMEYLYDRPIANKGIVQNNRMFYDDVIDICFERGGFGALIQFVYFILFVAQPSQRYWLPFQIVARRALTLGLLTLYINRAVIQGRTIFSEKTLQPGGSTLQAPREAKNRINTGLSSLTAADSMVSGKDIDDQELRGDPKKVFHVHVIRAVERDPPYNTSYDDDKGEQWNHVKD